MTAASGNNSDWLWMLDLQTLENIRKVTDRVVKKVIDRAGRENLRNGTDPNEYITDDDVREFVVIALAAWRELEISALNNLPVNSYPFSSFESTVRQAIRQASQIFRSVVTQLVLRTVGPTPSSPPSFGEFDDEEIVQGGDVRPILTAVGGGSNDPESPHGTGLTLGVIFLGWLGANGITGNEKVWNYGPAVRRTFEGHLLLDGLRFTSWQDERLTVRPQDAWIRANYYTPSDHFGCRCVVSLVLP